MIGTIGLIVSQLFPAILGYMFLSVLWKDAHVAARIGYGYLMGILLAVCLLYSFGIMGLALNFKVISTIILILILILIPFYHMICSSSGSPLRSPFEFSWRDLLWMLFVIVIVLRTIGLLAEELWRPLYPWDAWMNWAPKAKVWLELHKLVPFVHYFDWGEESLINSAYTLGNPEASTYPSLVPLMQTWASMGLGYWRDNWINISWGVLAIAFMLAFYGQLRMLQFSPLWSILSTMLVFNAPYMNTHTALGGYADIWIAAFYCAALMSFINWNFTKSKVQLALMFVMAIACFLTKIPGLIWAFTIVLGVLFAKTHMSVRYLLLLLTIGLVVSIVVGFGITFEIVGNHVFSLTKNAIEIPGLGGYSISYHAIGKYILLNNLVFDNWHLLGWLCLVFILPAIVQASTDFRLQPIVITMSSGVLFIAFIFFYTDYYINAIDATTLNRATFHLLPALYYFINIALFKTKEA